MSYRRQTHRRVIVRLTALIAAFIGSLAACGSEAENSAPPSAPPTSSAIVKIMPLGDSITQSTKGLNSYRYYLWHLLINKGYHVDFVGSKHGVGDGPPADPDFDMDHEGHAGWRADEIATQVHVWATAASPDFVLLHIGTNDLSQRQTVDSTVNDIRSIIDVLRSVNPRVHILLAQIIAKVGVPSIAVLNGRLPALVADTQQPDSPIVLVDQYSGFDPSTMTYDGTHPNADGDSRMADRWFEKLAPMLDAFNAESHP
jgi:acyl-CoA thioesterase I